MLDCSTLRRRGTSAAACARVGAPSPLTKRRRPRVLDTLVPRPNPSSSARQKRGSSNASSARTDVSARWSGSERAPRGAAPARRTKATRYRSSAPAPKATSTRPSQPRSPSRAQSAALTAAMARPLLPNHRWRGRRRGSSAATVRSSASSTPAGAGARAGLDGRALDPIRLLRAVGPIESEPVEPVWPDAHHVGGRLDRGEDRVAENLDRPDPGELDEVELRGLRRPRQVGDDQHRLAPVPPEVREDLLVARSQERDRAAAEHRRGAARGDQPPHRAEERGGLPRLFGDVYRLVAVVGIGDHGLVEAPLARRREAPVPVARPLQRRAHAFAFDWGVV